VAASKERDDLGEGDNLGHRFFLYLAQSRSRCPASFCGSPAHTSTRWLPRLPTGWRSSAQRSCSHGRLRAPQHDIPRALALTILALIAVLPEYAVRYVPGLARPLKNPLRYGPLALVNMTGANRLLIGVGWPLVVFFVLAAPHAAAASV